MKSKRLYIKVKSLAFIFSVMDSHLRVLNRNDLIYDLKILFLLLHGK